MSKAENSPRRFLAENQTRISLSVTFATFSTALVFGAALEEEVTVSTTKKESSRS
jgi:hypothetical protein